MSKLNQFHPNLNMSSFYHKFLKYSRTLTAEKNLNIEAVEYFTTELGEFSPDLGRNHRGDSASKKTGQFQEYFHFYCWNS